jgi:AbrB family looped-hinge helix DNA binding protein
MDWGSQEYEICITLSSMKVGERGQVTIPKDIRERFGLGPNAEVEFTVQEGSIVLNKAPKETRPPKMEGPLQERPRGHRIRVG